MYVHYERDIKAHCGLAVSAEDYQTEGSRFKLCCTFFNLFFYFPPPPPSPAETFTFSSFTSSHCTQPLYLLYLMNMVAKDGGGGGGGVDSTAPWSYRLVEIMMVMCSVKSAHWVSCRYVHFLSCIILFLL